MTSPRDAVEINAAVIAHELTKADWTLLYEQLEALRAYWRTRLTRPESQRQEGDPAWRSSM